MLRFLSHAGLLVETATLQLTEQTFSRELLLGNLQCFFNVVVEDLDFHPRDFRLSQAKWACCLRFSIIRRRSLAQHPEFLKAFCGLYNSESYGIYKLMIWLSFYICTGRNKTCFGCGDGEGQPYREI